MSPINYDPRHVMTTVSKTFDENWLESLDRSCGYKISPDLQRAVALAKKGPVMTPINHDQHNMVTTIF